MSEQTMIERVARAIEGVNGGVNYDYMDFCRDAARAAVEAMRVPTEAMLAEVVQVPAHWDMDSKDGWAMKAAVTADRLTLASQWQAMIDGALSDHATTEGE